MIKNLLITLCFLTSSGVCFANKIDDLKTDNEVAEFIVSLDTTMFHSKYSPAFIIPHTENIKALSNAGAKSEIKNWQKVDFNNDGRTDLLAMGQWYHINPYVVIDLGNGKYKLLWLQYSVFAKIEPAVILEGKDGPFLLYYTNKRFFDSKAKDKFWGRDSIVTDTLVYRFDSFIEYNAKPAAKKIKSVTFTTNTCLGSCPELHITINSKGLATYDGGTYAKPKGRNISTIAPTDLAELLAVIDYIDFKKVNDNYQVSWTDSPTATLSIKFADGSTKSISDYGEKGTLGLQNIYSRFFGFYKNQQWQPN